MSKITELGSGQSAPHPPCLPLIQGALLHIQLYPIVLFTRSCYLQGLRDLLHSGSGIRPFQLEARPWGEAQDVSGIILRGVWIISVKRYKVLHLCRILITLEWEVGIRNFKMGGNAVILNGVVREGLIEKVTLEQRPEEDQRLNHGLSGQKGHQGDRGAQAKP